jgi:hypothetical protein
MTTITMKKNDGSTLSNMPELRSPRPPNNATNDQGSAGDSGGVEQGRKQNNGSNAFSTAQGFVCNGVI